MRPLTLVLLFTALVIPALPAMAQGENILLQEADSASDAFFVATHTQAAILGDGIDITQVQIVELDEALAISLTFNERPLPPGMRASASVEFRFADSYYVTLDHGHGCPAGALAARDPLTASDSFVSCLDLEGAVGDAQARWLVPKELLVDQLGGSIHVGDLLEGVVAQAWWSDESQTVIVQDRAPESDWWTSQPLALGTARVGRIELAAVNPTRASNGEATTIVYNVTVINRGPGLAHVSLASQDLPAGWHVRLPNIIELAEQQARHVPVIADIPFAHAHGTSAFFKVVGTDLDLGAVATIPLGIHWVDVPQPSGHHPTLYLHSAPADNNAEALFPYRTWFNGIDEDPDPSAEDAPVPPLYIGSTSGQSVDYGFPLAPRLLMGLQAKPDSVGLFHVPISLPLATGEARLEVQLQYLAPCPGKNPTSCSEIGEYARGNQTILPANGPTTVEFDVPLAINASMQRVEFTPNANLRLVLSLHTGTRQDFLLGPRPMLQTDQAYLTLPLEDYRDDPARFNGRIGALELQGEPVRVNPGRTAVSAITITNMENAPFNGRLRLPEIAVASSDVITIGPGENWAAAIQVSVPEFNALGTLPVYFLVEPDDPSKPATVGVILVDVIDLGVEDIPSQSLDAIAQPTPTLPFVWLLAIFLWMARKRIA